MRLLGEYPPLHPSPPRHLLLINIPNIFDFLHYRNHRHRIYRHDTILEAVKTLHAAAKRLNGTPAPAPGGPSTAAGAGGNGQQATTGTTTQQQQPYRKLESSFDMNALKTGAAGAGNRPGLGGDHGSLDSIVGHLLVVRAECLPRALAGPAPPPTAPILHNTSLASVLTQPNPTEHIQEVREGGILYGLLSLTHLSYN